MDTDELCLMIVTCDMCCYFVQEHLYYVQIVYEQYLWNNDTGTSLNLKVTGYLFHSTMVTYFYNSWHTFFVFFFSSKFEHNTSTYACFERLFER